MKKVILVFVLFVQTFSSAETEQDGVIRYTDEFTGHTVCLQIAKNTPDNSTGVVLTNSSNHGLVITLLRNHSTSSNVVFNLFGQLHDDRVFLRIGDEEVITIVPDRTDVHEWNRSQGLYIRFSRDDYVAIDVGEVSESFSSIESATVKDSVLLHTLLDTKEDVRVRFRSAGKHTDFTIVHNVFARLAQGFGRECLDPTS